MIKNERQYMSTQSQLNQLRSASNMGRPEPLPPGVDARFFAAHERALESMMAELQTELTDYERLRSGATTAIVAVALADLPRALIQTRIARGLSQRALADRLGVAEQQIQRYEATEYESASFNRLKAIAEALEVEIPSTVFQKQGDVSLRHFFARLDELGFDRKLVLNKVLPRDLADSLADPVSATLDDARAAIVRAAGYVARALGIDIIEFFSSSPFEFGSNLAVPLYKRTVSQRARSLTGNESGSQKPVGAYVVYVHYLALLLLECTTPRLTTSLPTNPHDVRRQLVDEYSADDAISFEGALHLTWDLGIPVLPLSDSGVFHGACWRVGGRNAIVLKQRTQSTARWLFDLLHELRHASQYPGAEDFSIVESAPGSDVSNDEVDAMRFAGDVLLGGRAEEIAAIAVDSASGRLERLKSVVPHVAEREGVDVAALANYLAFRLAQQGENWWGAANNLQPIGEDPWEIARRVLLTRAELGRLNPMDHELILGALRGVSIEELAENR